MGDSEDFTEDTGLELTEMDSELTGLELLETALELTEDSEDTDLDLTGLDSHTELQPSRKMMTRKLKQKPTLAPLDLDIPLGFMALSDPDLAISELTLVLEASMDHTQDLEEFTVV